MDKIKNQVNDFFLRAEESNCFLKRDSQWPLIALEVIKTSNFDEELEFWKLMDKKFRDKEKIIGYCHKGMIYWKISILSLLKGELQSFVTWLVKSTHEDQVIGMTTSASIGMLSVITPLLTKKNRVDSRIANYHKSLSQEEKKNFADFIINAHDITATGRLSVINDSFFHFIQDEDIRRVLHSYYRESKNILVNSNSSFYSVVFLAGSILEAMLDDLFTRNGYQLWNVYKKLDKKVKKYREKNIMLGTKISYLEKLSANNQLPIPKYLILPMRVIHKYRNLIHPYQCQNSSFSAEDHYTASFVFTNISQLAHYWWENNTVK